jgi:hypothetical protein
MLISGAAVAESMPDGENGRYAMSATPDGVLRLDTRTGAMSTCSNSAAGWACYAIPDERAASCAFSFSLSACSRPISASIAARGPVVTGKIEEALPKSDALPKDESQPKSDSLRKAEPKAAEGERKIEIPLPSDRDMDRVMSFLERAWRRLIEMANRVQKDINGKI